MNLGVPYSESCILFLMVAIVTGVWIAPGPRGNETGRFVYKSPTQYDITLHCKFCEDKALLSSTFAYMQQKECLDYYTPYGDNIQPHLTEKERTLEKYPFCNEGDVPGCGPPPASMQDLSWICDPGYSNSLYSVYFTCNLTCNFNRKTSAVIYCNEKLEWENITYTSPECSKPPERVKTGGDDLGKVIIPIAIICGVFVLVAITIFCLCRRKKKQSSGSPAVERVNMKNISINENPAGIPLLPRPNTFDKEPRAPSETESSSIHDGSSHSSKSSIELPPVGGERNSQELSSLLSDQSEGSSLANQDKFDSVNEGGHCNSQVRPNSINSNGMHDSQKSQSLSEGAQVLAPDKPSSVSTGVSTSRPSSQKSTNSKNLCISNGSQGASIEVLVFETNVQSVSFYPSKNLQVTREGYSVPLSSNVFFNPIVPDGTIIKSFNVEKKDGSEYSGKSVGLKHCLEKVREEDEGLYLWTIIPADGEPISNSFQLFVVLPKDHLRQRLGPEGQEENRVVSGGQRPQQSQQSLGQNQPAVSQAVGTNAPVTTGPASNSDTRSNYSPLDPNSLYGSNPGNELGSDIRSNPGDSYFHNVVRSERDSYPGAGPLDLSPFHLHVSSLLTNSTENRRQDLRNNYGDDNRNELSPRLSNAERREECIVPLEVRPEPSGISVEIPFGDSIEDNAQYDDDEDDERHITPPKLVYERTHGE